MATLARDLGISERRLRALCAQGRVSGAVKNADSDQWDVSRAYEIRPGKRGPKLRYRRPRQVSNL